MKHENDNGSNIVNLYPKNSIPDADTVLMAAIGNIESSIVIGISKEDGSVYVASSEEDSLRVLGLIDIARNVVMECIKI